MAVLTSNRMAAVSRRAMWKAASRSLARRGLLRGVFEDPLRNLGHAHRRRPPRLGTRSRRLTTTTLIHRMIMAAVDSTTASPSGARALSLARAIGCT